MYMVLDSTASLNHHLFESSTLLHFLKVFWKVCFDEAVSESLASPFHHVLPTLVKTVT